MQHEKKNILNKRKIAVLGARSVGKSSLVVQYIDNHFVEAYYPTIENTFSKSISHRGTEFDCDIIDTAGQDEYSILNPKHAIGIHGYVLVYSVGSRSSFDIVQIVHDKLTNFCGKQTLPCVIVGAKSDIDQRQVASDEAEQLAKSLGSAFVESSARNNVNISRVFELCLGEIERGTARGQPAPDAGGRCVVM